MYRAYGGIWTKDSGARYRNRPVLPVHAGRRTERSRQHIRRTRRNGANVPRVALQRLDTRSTAPGWLSAERAPAIADGTAVQRRSAGGHPSGEWLNPGAATHSVATAPNCAGSRIVNRGIPTGGHCEIGEWRPNAGIARNSQYQPRSDSAARCDRESRFQLPACCRLHSVSYCILR